MRSTFKAVLGGTVIGVILAFAPDVIAVAGSYVENAGGGSGGISAATSGQVVYATAATTGTSEASGFAWDATNNRLGIGDDTPDAVCDVTSTAATGAVVPTLLVMSATDTLLTNATENSNVNYDLSSSRQWSGSGTVATQRSFRIQPGTITGSAATNTVTRASTLTVEGPQTAGANAAITTSIGIEVPARALTTVTTGIGAAFIAPTGASSNNLAVLVGALDGAPATTANQELRISSRGSGVLGISGDTDNTATNESAFIYWQQNTTGVSSANNNFGLSPGTNVCADGVSTCSGAVLGAMALRANSTPGFMVFGGVSGESVNIASTVNSDLGIGIGADPSPDAMLEINTAQNADAEVRLTATAAGGLDVKVSFGVVDDTASWSMGLDNSTTNNDFVLSTTALGTNNVFSVDGSTRVIAVGTAAGGGGLLGVPIAAQTIADTNTITADSCGGAKLITSAGAVTTNTTNTFTAPAAANARCCMDVINTGANNITLDVNANFVTNLGVDQLLTPDDAIRVCSTGASGKWFQVAPISVN
jgi:hypothetical protein